MVNEHIFTETELSRYDGEGRPMYIAYQGIVYDVTDCPRWRSGLHEGQHFPAQDLSQELLSAPHGEEVFLHPSAKRVGILNKFD